ncbi:MAG: TfoX/Sxy family protein [Endomicrobium sp.]|jgi:TfoX/Sxy family transcriptional regulator of competence genes|nr:TfoX/Sxy family protein [Endomicrobium sp.]
MASDLDFVNYVAEQIKNAGTVTYKKMFGEYLIYSNGKPVVLICDNTAFVKICDCVKPYLENAEKGFPYKGAKEHYIVDPDDGGILSSAVRALEKNLPVPKKKIKRK